MDREDAGNLCAPMRAWHGEERENKNSLCEQSDEENGEEWSSTWSLLA